MSPRSIPPERLKRIEYLQKRYTNKKIKVEYGNLNVSCEIAGIYPYDFDGDEPLICINNLRYGSGGQFFVLTDKEFTNILKRLFRFLTYLNYEFATIQHRHTDYSIWL